MPKKILIAEDDQFINDLYRMNLQQAGYDVVVALNGVEAVRLINESPPDLLLLDLLMPKLDGHRVLEKIRSQGHKFPVIILSNLTEDMDEATRMSLGVSEYFVKSELDLSKLLVAVRQYL